MLFLGRKPHGLMFELGFIIVCGYVVMTVGFQATEWYDQVGAFMLAFVLGLLGIQAKKAMSQHAENDEANLQGRIYWCGVTMLYHLFMLIKLVLITAVYYEKGFKTFLIDNYPLKLKFLFLTTGLFDFHYSFMFALWSKHGGAASNHFLGDLLSGCHNCCDSRPGELVEEVMNKKVFKSVPSILMDLCRRFTRKPGSSEDYQMSLEQRMLSSIVMHLFYVTYTIWDTTAYRSIDPEKAEVDAKSNEVYIMAPLGFLLGEQILFIFAGFAPIRSQMLKSSWCCLVVIVKSLDFILVFIGVAEGFGIIESLMKRVSDVLPNLDDQILELYMFRLILGIQVVDALCDLCNRLLPCCETEEARELRESGTASPMLRESESSHALSHAQRQTYPMQRETKLSHEQRQSYPMHS